MKERCSNTNLSTYLTEPEHPAELCTRVRLVAKIRCFAFLVVEKIFVSSCLPSIISSASKSLIFKTQICILQDNIYSFFHGIPFIMSVHIFFFYCNSQGLSCILYPKLDLSLLHGGALQSVDM